MAEDAQREVKPSAAMEKVSNLEAAMKLELQTQWLDILTLYYSVVSKN